ncbi:MAG: GNAT family N-acetyltransferase, partial [candidate division Zixibacteria bacterium]|nr:GNAT family N-acetyltransferase [candidate division Zixibacteria bacterium]
MGKDSLIFRSSVKSDIQSVYDIERNDENRSFIRQWTMEQHINAIVDNNYAHLIIETVEKRRTVGYIILVGLDNPDKSIEYKRLVISEKGKGFGRKAMQMMKKYVFEDLNAHRLWLEVIESNERAYKLYLSEGFVLEGKHRESMIIGEQFCSLNVMSLLESE